MRNGQNDHRTVSTLFSHRTNKTIQIKAGRNVLYIRGYGVTHTEFKCYQELIKTPQNFIGAIFSIKSLKSCHKISGEKGLRVVSPLYFVYDFWRKIFLTLYAINGSNFIV